MRSLAWLNRNPVRERTTFQSFVFTFFGILNRTSGKDQQANSGAPVANGTYHCRTFYQNSDGRSYYINSSGNKTFVDRTN